MKSAPAEITERAAMLRRLSYFAALDSLTEYTVTWMGDS